MKIFEIVKAPYLKEGGSTTEIMRSLLQDAVNLTDGGEDILFELLVQGGCRIGDPLRWFLSVRSKSMHAQQRSSVEKIIAHNMEERFRSSGYLIEPVTREEYEEATGGKYERICALRKELPVYRTSLSPMPYVQRPDLFQSKFNEVISLLDGTQAQIMFQICPTRLTEAEQQTVKERAVSYMNASQMLMSHDSIAAAAASNWADLSADENTPFALCAVFVLGSYEATAAITARLKGCYRQMSGAQVPFSVNTNLSDIHMYTLSELFPDAEDRFGGLYTMQELGVLCPLPAVTDTSSCGLKGNVASLLERQLIPGMLVASKGCRLGVCPEIGRTLSLPFSTLPKSCMVIGKSGCGKTTLAQMLAENLHLHGVPVIIVSPAKDFRRVARKGNMKIYRMGEQGFAINPFQLPRNVALKDYMPLLNDVFEGFIAMDGPLPSIIQESISRVYARYNYTSITKGVQETFGLTEFMEVLHSNVDDSLYDSELTNNLKSASAYRITRLLESCPAVFECLHGVTPEELLEGNGTLIEIDSNDFTARVAVSILMIQLVAYIKATSEAGHNDRTVRAIVMIDEAHRLLDASGSHYSTEESANAAAMTERLFHTAITELRKERVGTFILDQSICRMPPALIDACGTHILMHLTGTEAEEAARKTSVDPRVFAHMTTGEAVVVSTDLAPTFIQTFARPDGFLSDNDVATYMAARTQNKPIPHPFKACSACAGCKDGCSPKTKAVGDMLAKKIQVHRRKDGELTEIKLEGLCYAIPKILRRHGYNDARLPACTAVHLTSRIVRATGLTPKAGTEQLVAAVDEIEREEGGFGEEAK